MGGAGLWLRWSLRDLRKRVVVVVAIALVIALGTGLSASLGSTAAWRRASNDASFALLGMYDLRVELSQGAFVPAGALTGAAAGIDAAAAVAAAEERLLVPTQVDPGPGGAGPLPGRLVGVDVTAGGPHVNGVLASSGRDLGAADAGRPVAVFEESVAEDEGIEPGDTVEVSGGGTVEIVGRGTSPEYFFGPGAAAFGQRSAVLFVPAGTAQDLAGRPGMVNDLVLTLEPGADRGVVRRQVAGAIAEALPDVGFTLMGPRDEESYRVLYDDIDNDARFWNVIGALIFAGAAFAAFNLVSRLVDSQRREIGVGMALGMTRRRLAIRPLLIGAEIAALGVVAGLGAGLLFDRLLRSVFETVLPLPVWETPFQAGPYARAALLGFLIPLVATVIPVVRALRVEPIDAIRTGHLAARGSGLAPLLQRVPVPGRRALAQMPVRNLLRTPRRTLLTALGVGAAITTMVGVIGLVDSFVATIDAGEEELGGRSPDRVVVDLDTFYAADGPEVAAVATASGVHRAEPGLRLAATATGPDDSFDVLVRLLELGGTDQLWQPTVAPAGADATRGVVLAEKAAADLGVDVGDRVLLRHPQRRGEGAFAMVESPFVVAATHPNPMRPLAYLDISHAERFGLAGAANVVEIAVDPSVTTRALRTELFAEDAVVGVESVGESSERIRDMLEEFFGVLRVAELVVLVLALLIALNSTTITVDERSREHATLFAFGLPVRRVLGITTVESVLTGLLGTGLGIAAGFVLIRWMATSLVADTMPELDMRVFVSPATILTALVLGVVAVAVAPLLTVRRLRRMDIPGTLRYVE